MFDPATFKIDTTQPVLVTGATGYLAGVLVRQLLAAGITVHAAVRDPANEAKVAPLKTLGGDLKLFKADLLEPGSYAEAMVGCAHVFHTASPCNFDFTDPQTQMVDPALKGTENILETASQTPSVKRVILTSSMAAIYGDVADIEGYPNGTMTEAQWNTSSTLHHQTYAYSKQLAERRAWALAEGAPWQLLVINPGVVVGPGITNTPTSESYVQISQLVDGTLSFGVPNFYLGWVDVEDVALAHIRAAYLARAQGRYVVVAEEKTSFDMARDVRAARPHMKTPPRVLPKWLVKLVVPWRSKTLTRRVLERNIGYRWRFDNTKAREQLGLNFRQAAPATIAMADQIMGPKI